MSFEAGKKLGPYEIIEPIGAGGMGEVFKAKDTRLDRIVAIKVLNVHIANNPDLKSRFEREAKAISSLNHPNICTLYDIGVEDNTDYLVMEYIEGESLSDKIKKGALSVNEVLDIAIQIADALDKAHRQGLIHRDLKPGNIMLTKDGAKLLDFGLAKLQVEGTEPGVQSVTQTTPLTGAGMLIGTMQYMSPEQLEGQEADQRSDIFSFGAVIYEMATGARPFAGNSQASLIASILKEQPRSVSEVLPAVPPMLEQAVSQCLEKDPDQRWQSAGDLKRALKWISEGKAGTKPVGLIPHNRSVRENIIFSALILFVLATAFLSYQFFNQEAPERPVSKFLIKPSGNINSMNWPTISPDGKHLAFVASSEETNTRQIWVRPLHSLDAYPLPGTDGALRPFWSPDSRQLAYFSSGQLKKVPIGGGPPQLICETTGADGHWGNSNIIIFDNNVGDSLSQVSASGGIASPATSLVKGESIHAWPYFLPDGKHFLYMAGIDSLSGSTESYMLRVASIDQSVSKDLFRIGTRPVYSKAGYIMYVQDNTLLAQKFDEGKLEIVGDPVPAAENVSVQANNRSNFSVSDNGVLIYQRGLQMEFSQILTLNRKGEVLDTILDKGQYGDIAISNDGTRLAYELNDPSKNTSNIWIRDLVRNVSSRLTFGDKSERFPRWSPDGSQIVYSSNEKGSYSLFNRRSNGLGDKDSVLAVEGAQLAVTDWMAQDNSLYIVHFTGQGDIWKIYPGTDSTEKIMTNPKIFEAFAKMSPNNKYMVYVSGETGKSEVFIRDLSDRGGKWQVSNDAGNTPFWTKGGKEIFFLNGRNEFMAVPISEVNGVIQIGIPEKLFSTRLNFRGQTIYRYDVSKDGEKIYVNVPVENQRNNETDFVVVMNWNEELESK